MSSPFKMKYGGASALLKTLVGDQKSLPPQLKKAIEAAPELSPAKSYGKSPVKKDDKFVDVDVDKAESKEVKIKGGRGKTQTVTKQTVQRVVPRSAGEKTSGERKYENTMAARQGEGRLGTKTTITAGSSTKAKTGLAGTAKDASGRTKYRTLADGTKVVVEGSVNAFTKKSPAKMKGVKGLKKNKK